MKQILFIGSRKKYEPFVRYCKKKNYDYKIFEAKPGLENESLDLQPETEFVGYSNFFNTEFYQDQFFASGFSPDLIVMQRDQEKWLRLEQELNEIYLEPEAIDNFLLSFFAKKSVQDKVCRELLIPVMPRDGENLVVKKDSGFSGGTGYYSCPAKEYTPSKNDFVQREMNIQKTIGVHLYIDNEGGWNILNFHHMTYDNNYPAHSVSCLWPKDDHMKVIRDGVMKLSRSLEIRNRLVFWQFLVDKSDSIYSMDFNCRVSGGYEAGSYDEEVSDACWAQWLIEKQVPRSITFNQSVRCFYNEKVKFGYSSYSRSIEPITPKVYQVERYIGGQRDE